MADGWPPRMTRILRMDGHYRRTLRTTPEDDSPARRFARRCEVIALELASNQMAGTLPAALGSLSRLQRLDLFGNELAGDLPEVLLTLGTGGGLPSLRLLDLRRNQFSYDTALLEPLVTHCKVPGGLLCLGLPPQSCSAFGVQYRVRTEKPDVCVRCIAWVAALVLNVCVSLVLLGALGAYVYMIAHNRYAIKRWIASVSIVLNHAQTVAIVGTIQLGWPQSRFSSML